MMAQLEICSLDDLAHNEIFVCEGEIMVMVNVLPNHPLCDDEPIPVIKIGNIEGEQFIFDSQQNDFVYYDSVVYRIRKHF